MNTEIQTGQSQKWDGECAHTIIKSRFCQQFCHKNRDVPTDNAHNQVSERCS